MVEKIILWRKRDVVYSFMLYCLTLFLFIFFESEFIGSSADIGSYSLFLFEETIDAIILIGITILIVRKHYKYKIESIGLTFEKLSKNIVLGILCGVLLWFSSLLFEMLITHYFGPNPLFEHPFNSMIVNSQTFFDYMVVLFCACILAPLSEEIYFRGFVYTVFRNHYGIVVSTTICGFIFAVVHLNPWWFVQTFLLGMAFCFLVEFTGSVLSALSAHTTINLLSFIVIRGWI